MAGDTEASGNVAAAAVEAVQRALGTSDGDRVAVIREAFSDRPLLCETLEGILTGGDTSWLDTGGAWNPRFEEQIQETLRLEPLAIGDRVGEIRIRERLGTGGMGTVYLGFDERLEREVAVKTVSLDDRVRPMARERFEREARVLSRLNHPAICQIYSVVDASAGGSSFQCLILERVHGETLSREMANLDSEARLRTLEQVARALAVAHGEGIIHRDLKPDNVMLTPEGEVKILDFGISRFSDAESLHRDAETFDETGGRLIGTPRYMSPEQARCESLTPASDLYSLGLLVKELVTDEPAHPDDSTPFDLVRRAAEAQVEPLDDSVDSEIADLVHDLLARDPSSRPTASETADRIGRVLDRPLRRRRLLVRSAVGAVTLLALLAAAWASVRAWQARRDAERQSVTARRLGEEVRSIDSLLRSAYLAPPHAVETERRWVEERLRRIEREYGGAGPWAAGPLSYARGRIVLALGRPEEAKVALEAGWQLGYRDSSLAEALGLAYGALYDRATEEARRLPTEDQRNVALEEADLELRRTAVDWLARASGQFEDSGPDLGQLAEAWIALYENRFDEARDLTDRVVRQAPWLYDALRIRGLASLRQASELGRSGRIEESARKMSEAESAFDEALRIARSDPELHLERCRLGHEAITVSYRAGHDVQEAYERAVGSCRGARALLPADPSPRLGEALLEYFVAWSRSEVLQDPTESLDRMAVLAEEARQLDPQSSEAHRLLGMAASLRGSWASTMGGSGQAHLSQAQEHLKRAVELDPDSTSPRYALGVALFNMGYEELLDGQDPRPSLRQAAKALEEAQRLSPGSYSALSMLGSTYGIMAMYSLENGLEPLELLRQSIHSFEQAISIEPTAPAPRANLAMAYRDLATFHWLTGSDPGSLESALAKGIGTAQSIIADKPNSAFARISLGELQLLRARSRLDRGLAAEDDLAEVTRIADELAELGLAANATLSLRAKALHLRARAAVGRPRDVEFLTRRGIEVADEWAASGGGHGAAIVVARLHLLRASAGIDRVREIRRGLEAADRALAMRPGAGEASLVKAELLALAGRPAEQVHEALAEAVAGNRWLRRQASAVEKRIDKPVS